MVVLQISINKIIVLVVVVVVCGGRELDSLYCTVLYCTVLQLKFNLCHWLMRCKSAELESRKKKVARVGDNRGDIMRQEDP